MSKQNIIDIVTSMFNEIVNDSEIELVDVEYVKEGTAWFLRVYIDKSSGVDIDDCRRISQELSVKLDKIDPISHAYTLEVSSPGLERPLKKEKDFQRFRGQLVNIKTYQAINGIKEFQGQLIGVDSGIVKLDINGEEQEIPFDKIAKAQLAIEF